MKLIIPLLALFTVLGLTRRNVRAFEAVVLVTAIVLLSAVYLITWAP